MIKGEHLMNGLVVNLYKDVQETGNSNSGIRNNFPNLVWTYYDRIKFHEVDKMENYFIQNNNKDDWVGSVQSLHLYRSKASKFKYDNSSGKNCLIGCNSHDRKPRFFCITSITLSSEIKKIIEFNNQLGMEKINSDIIGYLEKYFDWIIANKNIKDDSNEHAGLEYEIYNSLGAEDLAVVFISDSLEAFYKAVEGLKELEFKKEYTPLINDNDSDNKDKNTVEDSSLIKNTYTIVGINNLDTKAFDYDIPLNVDFRVSFSIKNNDKFNTYIECLEKLAKKFGETVEIRNRFGKYDAQIEIKEPKLQLIKMYIDCNNSSGGGTHDVQGEEEINDPTGFLTASKSIYRKAIYQSRTVLIYNNTINKYDKQFTEPFVIPLNNKDEKNDRNELMKEAEKESNTLIELLANDNINIKSKHFKEEIRILFRELSCYMHSAFLEQWNFDLALQFKTFSECLKTYITKEKYFGHQSAIVTSIEDFKAIYHHITKGTRTFFEDSEATSYYSGSYNNILRAYYGIIKTILSIGYAIPHDKNSQQSNITFAVNFDITEKVYSKQYLLSQGENNSKLVSFYLPYEALCDIPKYMAYLIHEVFHYIAPVNRKVRNEVIFKIGTDMLVRSYLCEYLCAIYFNLIDIERETEIKDFNSLHKRIREIVNYIIMTYFSRQIFNMIEDAIDASARLDSIFNKQSLFFFDEMENVFANNNSGTIDLFGKIISDLTELFIRFIQNSKNRQIGKELKNRFNNEYQDDIDDFLEKYYSIEKLNVNRKNVIFAKARMSIDKTSTRAKLSDFLNQAMYDGFSEAICDLYIINILEIDFKHYLDIFFALYLNTKVDDINDPNQYIHDSTFLRIGILFDVFYGTYSEYESNIYDFNCCVDEWTNKSPKKRKKCAESLKIYYELYLKYFGQYREMFYEYMKHLNLPEIFENMKKIYSDDILNYWEFDISVVRKFYNEYLRIKTVSNNQENDLLKLNIKMVERFQYQRPIHKLYKKCNEQHNIYASQNYSPLISDIKYPLTDSRSEKSEVVSIFVPRTNDIQEYLNQVYCIIKEFEKNSKGSFWFRGMCNCNFDLRPSIFRSVPKDVSLYAYEAAVLKEVQGSTLHYPKLWAQDMTNIAEQISCMQHYGAPTNLLDFSTNALNALHFALNPDIVDPKNDSADAVVYILDPQEFNRAMNTLVGKENENNKSYYPIYCSNLLSEQWFENYFPYDCTDHHINNMQEKFLCDKFITKLSNKSFNFNKLTPPRAMQISQTNDRIKAQSGTFVAIPLDLPINISEYSDSDVGDNRNKKGFDYICLKNLQREYIKMKPDGKLFLREVIISSECKNYLKEQLKSMGIIKSKLYPELDKIVINAKENIDNFFGM